MLTSGKQDHYDLRISNPAQWMSAQVFLFGLLFFTFHNFDIILPVPALLTRFINNSNNSKFNIHFTIQEQRQGRPEYTRKTQTTPSKQKAQTVPQRRDKHGAISKIQLPIEERRAHGEKRWVLRSEWNEVMEEEVRRARGGEFQIVGTANRKARRAWADLKKWSVSRCWSEERSERGGQWGIRRLLS